MIGGRLNRQHSEFSNLHPAVSFIYYVSVITVTIISTNPVMLGIAFITSFIYSIMCHGLCMIKKLMLITVPVILFSMIVQPLFSHNGNTPLFYINGNAVTLEAIIYGLAVSVLLMSTIQWFYTYNVIISSDKFIYLFGRVAPALALIVSMVFRTLPQLKRRYQEIEEAQIALGRKKDKVNLYTRITLWLKELSILLSWSLEDSMETSDSMESRGYGLKGRTSFHLFKWTRKDFIWLFTILCFTSVCIYGIYTKSVQVFYFPIYEMKPLDYWSFTTFVSFAFLGIVPIIYDLGGKYKWQRLNSRM